MPSARSKAADQVWLITELNDLIQLDIDAVQAYTLAIGLVRDRAVGDTLRRFRGDHERHVRVLSDLVRAQDGRPATLPHLPTGMLKLMVQAAGAFGGDLGVLLALQTNEAQSRDKYARHAFASTEALHPAAVATALEAHAADEQDYAWVTHMAAALGAGPGTPLGTAVEAFEAMHGANADAIEAAQRLGAAAVERAWRAAVPAPPR